MIMRSSISGHSSLRSVMEMMKRDPCTLDLLAERTGLSKEALVGRLETMVGMGLVEAVGNDASSCNKGCHGCRASFSCVSLTAYRLTDKGRSAISQT
jgi:predicted transcriptional regulator